MEAVEPLRRNILIVDDDPATRRVVRQSLQRAGYDVTEATGLVEAVIALEGPRGVQGMVTDLNMPGGGGADLIEWVRHLWPDLAVVCLTGSPTSPDLPVPVLHKPLTGRELIMCLRQAFGETHPTSADGDQRRQLTSMRMSPGARR